ncbi:MAG: efflux RND transporter permease subunit [Lentisphaerae bacterium]|nr:efflux RND transporter permease subunit [Lentisphaerota bacterium]
MIVSNLAIRFRVAVLVFVVMAVIGGSYSYVSLPREGFPDITIPHVYVTAVYDGTSPEEIERLIAIPLEKKLNDVDGIKTLRTTAAENACIVDVEFMAGQDIEQARIRVKDKVDLARPDLPDDLDEPVVEALNFSTDVPVFTFAVSGDADAVRLKSLAEQLQDRIELVPGVRQAEIAGTLEREIRVVVDQSRLAAYGVTLPLVLQRLSEENATVTAGNLEVAGSKFQVRVPGEFRLASELQGILLATREGRPVYLTDVATIEDTTKDRDSISRLDGKPCVSISVTKRAGENAVELIRRVKQVLDGFLLPPEVRLTTVMDMSDYVATMIAELENNIFSGFVLVVLVLLVFMGLRNALLVGLAIPLSMLVSFIVMRLYGATLNMMVLFSLVLSVGMLVDNAIVIVENTYRLRAEGRARLDAARTGAAEVAWPVITSTLTTVGAFVPLMFWPDIMGQFMWFMPWTIIITLSSSLFVGLVMNPAICSFLIQARPRDTAERRHSFVRGYERFLRGVLTHRVPSLLLGFLFLVLSVVVYGRLDLGVELFPTVEPRNAQIYVKFPQGTTIDRTDAMVRRIEPLLADPDVKFVLTTVGASAGGDALFGMGTGGPHQAKIHVEFRKMEERKGSSLALVNRIRESMPVVPGAEILVEREKEGPPTGAPVEVEISGDDFETLRQVASDVNAMVAATPGVVDLRDDFEDALPELQFHVDRERAALLGADTRSIGTFLRMSLYGIEGGKFRGEKDEFDITVRLPADQRNTLEWLDRVRIPTASGATVPITSLGEFRYSAGRGAIQRKDQKRVIKISANDAGRGVDKILADVKARVGGLALPRGYAVAFTGENQEMQQSGAFLFRAFMIASAAILIILVIQFNSVLVPGIIFSSVVLSLVGVMWGLVACGMKFGIIMTGLGVITLAGVVVNNAIVLIDCIRQLREEGLPLREAIVAAGIRRLRPVMLTASTTVLGLIPMAVGWSLEIHTWPWTLVSGAESSAWWAPMAVAVIFGLTVATVLTLGLVPAMYSLVAGVVEWAQRRLTSDD